MRSRLVVSGIALLTGAVLVGSGGCSSAASGSDWNRTDIARAAPDGLVLGEIVATAGWSESGVTEVVVTAQRPEAAVPEVVVSALRPLPGGGPRLALEPDPATPGS